MKIDGPFKRRFRGRLLSWYDEQRRELPWRETTDPYQIWVSEVMLQQTQVNTVKPYYERFINRFPTVVDLAEAELNDVMKLWEGLGYYGRARHLHKAAREILVRFAGRIPDNLQDLLSLPGIGRYTAGAILSIAFHEPVPILDGNVIRLFTRIFHVTECVDKSETRKVLWNIAGELLPLKRIDDFNQGIMEVGSIICKPGRPLCDACPLETLCEAKRLSIQAQLPVRRPRKPIPHYHVTAGIIWRGRICSSLCVLQKGSWEGSGSYPVENWKKGKIWRAVYTEKFERNWESKFKSAICSLRSNMHIPILKSHFMHFIAHMSMERFSLLSAMIIDGFLPGNLKSTHFRLRIGRSLKCSRKSIMNRQVWEFGQMDRNWSNGVLE